MNTPTRLCTTDRHTDCHQPGCVCGCHWLTPLVTGTATTTVSPSGRTWRRA